MTEYETRKLELEIELMTVQIDRGRVDIEKMQTEMEKLRAEIRLMERWEPWKALAALALGVAALSGAIVGSEIKSTLQLHSWILSFNTGLALLVLGRLFLPHSGS
jgi:hypothetical protein